MQRVRTSSAGFTLVEILAVIAILGLLVSLAIPAITKARASGDTRGCQSNLNQIAVTLQNYVDQRNGHKWPKYSGIQFLLVLAKEGEIKGETLEVFTCPATGDNTYEDEADRTPGTGYKDWDSLNKTCISYAGRDNKTYPLRQDKADQEIIAADDNDERANHAFLTNFVYMDGRVSSTDVKDFRADLGEEAEWIPVGPESPHEGLKKLVVD